MASKLMDHRIYAAAQMQEFALAGLSTEAIAQALNARGFRTLQGKAWTQHNVARVMRRTGATPANKRRPRSKPPVDHLPIRNIRKETEDLAGLALLLSSGDITARFAEHEESEGTFALSGPISELHRLLVGVLKAPRKALA